MHLNVPEGGFHQGGFNRGDLSLQGLPPQLEWRKCFPFNCQKFSVFCPVVCVRAFPGGGELAWSCKSVSQKELGLPFVSCRLWVFELPWRWLRGKLHLWCQQKDGSLHGLQKQDTRRQVRWVHGQLLPESCCNQCESGLPWWITVCW